MTTLTVPDIDCIGVSVDQLDAERTPLWDSLAPRWAEVQTVLASEAAHA